MKKILLFSLIALHSITFFAQEKVQIKLASASPAASFEQELGTATIKVNYNKPLARGRKIFGDLVPFDKIWRTGASNATQIITNEEIIFGSTNLKPGSYSLFTIPSQNEWTIIVNTDTTLHGDSGYDEKKDVLRFKIPVEKSSNFYESFTIEINDINSKGEAFLKIIWENTMVKIPVKSLHDDIVLALIDKNIIKQKTQDATLLFQAANYYNSTKRDAKQAIQWLMEAEKIEPDNFNFPNLRQKIAAELKDYPTAIEAAKKAVKNAEIKKMKTPETLIKKIADWEMLIKK